ncbi:hypothetical protein EVAR_8578_1 [Eumeta japonica]|uniref:Uncharacterized protein n=1 Tax=Eumeta variegata TaxID=151549 RepID=A0A4C1TXN2_EUMVA|nr:hypothetical protein EVAR_8578_1 [Eumeta japonica]
MARQLLKVNEPELLSPRRPPLYPPPPRPRGPGCLRPLPRVRTNLDVHYCNGPHCKKRHMNPLAVSTRDDSSRPMPTCVDLQHSTYADKCGLAAVDLCRQVLTCSSRPTPTSVDLQQSTYADKFSTLDGSSRPTPTSVDLQQSTYADKCGLAAVDLCRQVLTCSSQHARRQQSTYADKCTLDGSSRPTPTSGDLHQTARSTVAVDLRRQVLTCSSRPTPTNSALDSSSRPTPTSVDLQQSTYADKCGLAAVDLCRQVLTCSSRPTPTSVDLRQSARSTAAVDLRRQVVTCIRQRARQ